MSKNGPYSSRDIDKGIEPVWKINSVEKCFRVLKCFTNAKPEWTLTQLSQKLKLPKSSLLNMLKTLELDELVVKSQVNGTYCLGVEFLEIAYNARSSVPIIQYAIPFLDELHEKTGKAIYLTIPKNGMTLYIESIFNNRRNLNYSITGKTLPMHCTGCGKAMLSHMSREDIDIIVSHVGLERFTPATITDYDALMAELRATWERGYAIDRGEESHGVKCVAVPIIWNNAVLGAVSISGSILNMTDDIFPEYAEMLMTVASLMSTKADLFPKCSHLPKNAVK